MIHRRCYCGSDTHRAKSWMRFWFGDHWARWTAAWFLSLIALSVLVATR
jgi:hypothetical protein